MLTALADDIDRIVGIEIGADDYITKPLQLPASWSPASAACSAGCAGQGPAADSRPRALRFKGWKIDPVARQLYDPEGVQVDDDERGIRPAVRLLPQSGAGPITRAASRPDAWRTGRADRPASIDVHVSRVRQKIEPDPQQPTLIKTVRPGRLYLHPHGRGWPSCVFPPVWCRKPSPASLPRLVAVAAILGVALHRRDAPIPQHGGAQGCARHRGQGRLAAISQLAQAQPTPAALTGMVQSARRAGFEVELVETADPSGPQSLLEAKPPIRYSGYSGAQELLAHPLRPTALPAPIADPDRIITVWVDEPPQAGLPSSARDWAAPPRRRAGAAGNQHPRHLYPPAVGIFPSVRSSAPLASMASAAQAFGDAPKEPMLSEAGPREIAQVARALNEMGARIHALVEARTRMLAAHQPRSAHAAQPGSGCAWNG